MSPLLNGPRELGGRGPQMWMLVRVRSVQLWAPGEGQPGTASRQASARRDVHSDDHAVNPTESCALGADSL